MQFELLGGGRSAGSDVDDVSWLVVLDHVGAEWSEDQVSENEPETSDEGEDLQEAEENVLIVSSRSLLLSSGSIGSKKSSGAVLVCKLGIDVLHVLRFVESILVLDEPDLLVDNLGGLDGEGSIEDSLEIVIRLEVDLDSTVWLQVLSGDNSLVFKTGIEVDTLVHLQWPSWSGEDLLHLVLDLLEVDDISALLADTSIAPVAHVVGLVEAVPVVEEVRGLGNDSHWLVLGLDLDLDGISELVALES